MSVEIPTFLAEQTSEVEGFSFSKNIHRLLLQKQLLFGCQVWVVHFFLILGSQHLHLIPGLPVLSLDALSVFFLILRKESFELLGEVLMA